MFAPLL